MTIGLILLALISILIFFGVTETFFRKMGIKNWLAFVLVVLLISGAIIPKIQIGTALSVNIGGFIVPLVIMVMFMSLIRTKSELLRTILCIPVVASIAVSIRILIEPNNAGLIFASSLIVGFVSAIVAFLTARTRLSVLSSVLGGIILGDIIVNTIYKFVFSSTFFLGGLGVFDSVIIALVGSAILVEAIGAVRRINSLKRVSRTALNFESGKDENIQEKRQEKIEDEKQDFGNFFDDFI